MGILDDLLLIQPPKPYVESKTIDSIIVASGNAWYALISYRSGGTCKIRMDIPVGESKTGDDIVLISKLFPNNDNSIESIRFEESEVKYAIITFTDGTKDVRDLSDFDQDIPVGTILETNNCRAHYKKEIVANRAIPYTRVIEIHYSGLDFVDTWTMISEHPINDIYEAAEIKDIIVVLGEYGFDALLLFADEHYQSLHLDYRSRPVKLGEILRPDECFIVKMRKYHTLVKDILLVKD